MKKKYYIYLLFILIIFNFEFYTTKANAKDYPGTGEYRFGPNVAESIACNTAFERAKKNALSNALGEHLFSQDFMRCSEADNAECELNKTIISTINGRIKKIKEKQRTLTKQEGSSTCIYEIICDIAKPKKQKDANFHFNLMLNKKIFRNDEKFMIDIEPNMKMFVNIFQWNPYIAEGNNLTKIFPNKYESNNEIEKKRKIPDIKSGYSFIVEYPTETQKKKYVDEYLIVLATKKDNDFMDNYKFKKFQKIISEIPNDEFRMEKINYEIHKN
jgi:hypothetical protein|tara:strand:+ start:1102 stop:1917 length:816 start_codon:yes stop_codon:yes gene_type:complete